MGRTIRYEPVGIPEFADRLTGSGVPPHRVQHLANVAADYRNGVFSGTNDHVASIGGVTPTSVEEFALRNEDYFEDPEQWGHWNYARRG